MHLNPYEPPQVSCAHQATLACSKSCGIDRTWRVDCLQQSHEIRVLHGYWSGQATIEVDDDVIYHRASKLIDWGLAHTFVVDGVRFTVRITTSWLPFRYELLVDDSAAEMGNPFLATTAASTTS